MWFLELAFHKYYDLHNTKVGVGKKYVTGGICGWGVCGTWKLGERSTSAFITHGSDNDFFPT
jgi:hypothetical protein